MNIIEYNRKNKWILNKESINILYFSLLTFLTKNTFSIHNIYFESKQYCVPFLCEFEIWCYNVFYLHFFINFHNKWIYITNWTGIKFAPFIFRFWYIIHNFVVWNVILTEKNILFNMINKPQMKFYYILQLLKLISNRSIFILLELDQCFFVIKILIWWIYKGFW